MMLNRLFKKRLLILIFILTLLCSLSGQTAGQESETTQTRTEDIIVEEEIIDAEIIIRVPESSVQPRTRTEELNFTLNYLRRMILESNKELY